MVCLTPHNIAFNINVSYLVNVVEKMRVDVITNDYSPPFAAPATPTNRFFLPSNKQCSHRLLTHA